MKYALAFLAAVLATSAGAQQPQSAADAQLGACARKLADEVYGAVGWQARAETAEARVAQLQAQLDEATKKPDGKEKK